MVGPTLPKTKSNMARGCQLKSLTS